MARNLSETAELAENELPNSVRSTDSIFHEDGVFVKADPDGVGQLFAFARRNGLERDGLKRRESMDSKLAGWLYDPETSEPRPE